MAEFGVVITQNILPILLVASFGYALRRWRDPDPRVLASVVLNVFSPALVFTSLVNSRIPAGELLDLALFTVLVIAGLGLLALLAAKVLRLRRLDMAALLIVVMFGNTGNYGLTLVQLRYGEAGLARGIVFYTVSTMLVYTLGIFVASLGAVPWRRALGRTLRMPAFYATVLAVLIYSFDVTVPRPLMSALEIAAAGAIPVMLLVLGMQLAELKPSTINIRLTVPALGLRLLAGPLVAVAVAAGLGLSGVTRSAAIIEASMPTAVLTIILATEFGLPIAAVTSIVVIGTLISPFTVAATISLLGL